MVVISSKSQGCESDSRSFRDGLLTKMANTLIIWRSTLHMKTKMQGSSNGLRSDSDALGGSSSLNQSTHLISCHLVFMCC